MEISSFNCRQYLSSCFYLLFGSPFVKESSVNEQSFRNLHVRRQFKTQILFLTAREGTWDSLGTKVQRFRSHLVVDGIFLSLSATQLDKFSLSILNWTNF